MHSKDTQKALSRQYTLSMHSIDTVYIQQTQYTLNMYSMVTGIAARNADLINLRARVGVQTADSPNKSSSAGVTMVYELSTHSGRIGNLQNVIIV